MKLMMYIGNDLIESIQLESERISKPGYVGNIKRILKMKYSVLIQQSEEKPEFLIIEPAPVTGRLINKQQSNPDNMR